MDIRKKIANMLSTDKSNDEYVSVDTQQYLLPVKTEKIEITGCASIDIWNNELDPIDAAAGIHIDEGRYLHRGDMVYIVRKKEEK